MGAFNMPPGASPNQIPGNTPADMAAEALADMVFDRLSRVPTFTELDETTREALAVTVEALAIEIDAQARSAGYDDALATAAEARETAREFDREAIERAAMLADHKARLIEELEPKPWRRSARQRDALRTLRAFAAYSRQLVECEL